MPFAARRHTDNKKMNRRMIDWQNWLNSNVFLFIRLQLLFVTLDNTKRWAKAFNGKSLINCFRIQKGSSVTNFWSVMNVLVCVRFFHLYPFFWQSWASFFLPLQQKLFNFPFAILVRPHCSSMAQQQSAANDGSSDDEDRNANDGVCQLNIYNFFYNKFIIEHIETYRNQ